VADPYYNYVDVQFGVVNKYAYVIESFTYSPAGRTTSAYFDELVEQDVIREIIVQNGDNGLPIAKYNPRFPAGTYLKYKAGTETLCVLGDTGCNPLEAPAYDYYIAGKYFTPTSTNPQDLINQGLIFPLYINSGQYVSFLDTLATNSNLTQPTRMFRFFKGDRTFFRQGSQVISYTATTDVHPLFEFYIYLENGVFVETERFVPAQIESQDYVPYFDPSYELYSEDTVLSEDGRNLYRVMLAFTPPETVVNWTNTTVANSTRYEEFIPNDTGREGSGNLLRYVDQYVCEEGILSQFGRDISAIKLGVAQITIIPKNSGRFSNSRNNEVYVWENTSTLSEVPQLSWYSGTNYPFLPPKYGAGTMKL
jgi:hypothetical protein